VIEALAYDIVTLSATLKRESKRMSLVTRFRALS